MRSLATVTRGSRGEGGLEQRAVSTLLPTLATVLPTLLARVLGQALVEREGGVFAIARRVAPDRVISTADPEARHGIETASRGSGGYEGHIAVDRKEHDRARRPKVERAIAQLARHKHGGS